MLTRPVTAPSHVVRQLVAAGTLVRWFGVALLGAVGLADPPKLPAFLGMLVVGVAAYNGVSVHAIRRVDDAGAVRLARILVLLDTLTLFALLAAFTDEGPPGLYAISTWIVIEATVLDGAHGAAAALGQFLTVLLALQALRVVSFHLPVDASEVLVWIAVTGVTALILSVLRTRFSYGTLPGQDRGPGTAMTLGAARVSQRELEVLRLLAEGYSNSTIASTLHLSQNTIKRHVDSLLTRLNARNRAEAVAHAIRQQLL